MKMYKYCPECGIKNSEEAVFCRSCGIQIEKINLRGNITVQKENNNVIKSQYNVFSKSYTVSNKPLCRYKFITAIAVIGVVAILIGALILTGNLNDINNPIIDKIHVKGGPKANIESIVSGGNALTTPDEGHTAIYGYYLSGIRMGEISFTAEGEEIYNGIPCDKITGDGNFIFNIYGQSMEINFDIGAYISKSDGILSYCRYGFDFQNPYNMEMDMILDIDKEEGEITFTVDSSLIGSTSTVIKASNEFWDCTILKDELYVGYLKDVNYILNTLGYDTEVNLKISVIGKEDVIVKKGIFEDCFIIQIDQDQGFSTTTSMIWIDEDGICPKMQIGSSGSSSINYEGMTIELEEYYTTD
jgi:hypothetical protein